MTHDVRVRASSGGYGAADLWMECDTCHHTEQIGQFRPTLEDLVRLAAAHEGVRDPFERGDHGTAVGA